MVAVVVFFQAEDGIRDIGVTGVQTCALPICDRSKEDASRSARRCRISDGKNLSGEGYRSVGFIHEYPLTTATEMPTRCSTPSDLPKGSHPNTALWSVDYARQTLNRGISVKDAAAWTRTENLSRDFATISPRTSSIASPRSFRG